MTPRHQQLLVALIREYIRTANAISSSQLAEIVPFSASPATIRNLLRELEEEGFLWQPHTSAGRIPTDRAYRLYVDSLIVRDLAQHRVKQLEKRLRSATQESRLPTRAVSRLLSDLTHTIAVSGAPNSEQIHEAGLRLLLEQPEASEPDAIREISILLDGIDDLLAAISNNGHSEDSQTYIGQENPVTPGKHSAVIARRTQLKNGQEVFLLIIGPKRMPYDEHVPLLNAMANIVANI